MVKATRLGNEVGVYRGSKGPLFYNYLILNDSLEAYPPVRKRPEVTWEFYW